MKTGKSNIKFLQQNHKNCQASAYFDMRMILQFNEADMAK